MADLDLTNPIYSDEEKARAYLEGQRWPDGVSCPFCGTLDGIYPLNSASHGPGWYSCTACHKFFTVRVGSVMERSHIPLTKWAVVFHLMVASKKGGSAKQVQRMLGFTSYKSAWFMVMRVREAMKGDATAGPLGGEGKVIESDETFVGGKKKNVHKGKPEPKKHAVHALVERGGQVRASHIPDMTAKTLRSALEKTADRASKLHTDDALANLSVGKDFAEHQTVAHTLGEYVSKDGTVHTQDVESFFALIKRGITGSFHSVSEQHLQRYCDEFAFRWNTRSSLGIEDTERASRAIKGAVGKRLTYRWPNNKMDLPRFRGRVRSWVQGI
jgi:transposase-like protein